MADPDESFDEQDQSEVFDEENTNDADRGPGEDAEQFEDLVDLLDVTRADGDSDEDEPEIGDDLDDDEIVARGSDDVDEADNIEDDIADIADEDYPDDTEERLNSDEVELEYVGDLDDVAGASSAAQSLESDTLSDEDLRELDYKDK